MGEGERSSLAKRVTKKNHSVILSMVFTAKSGKSRLA
jgi:hypothetical protein